MDELGAFCQRKAVCRSAGCLPIGDDDAICFNFGQHKGKRVVDVLNANPGYFGWMMVDFPEYTKRCSSAFTIQ